MPQTSATGECLPDGVIYNALNNGELRRLRWNGNGWDTFPDGQNYEVIDNNPLWGRYSTTEYFNRITVDSLGDIYTIEPDGWLHWRRYNAAARTWAHRRVASGWFDDLIVAAGPGVIYARGARQYLSRFEYHAESQRSRSRGAGDGWDVFSRIFSPGGDLLYAVRADTGDLMWYRYDPDTESWANGKVNWAPVGLRIGAGWQGNYEVLAAPDSCQRSGIPWRPARPQVAPRPQAPVTLMLSTNGHLHYSYVDAEGRAVHADAPDLTGPVRLAAVPGMIGLTGTTSMAESEGGRIQIVGNGLDAEVRSNTETVSGGTWGQADTLGGFFTTSPTLARPSDKVLVLFSVDQAGFRWIRKPTCVSGSRYPWDIRDFDGAGAPRLDDRSPLVTVPIGSNDMRLIGRDGNGTVYAKLETRAVFGDECDSQNVATNGVVTVPTCGCPDKTWHSLGGSGFVGPASALLMPDRTLQVVATRSDGVVYTQRETSTGFPGTWTPVSTGITASGPASAILAPDGKIKVVVRGTDGLIYYTSQTAPDASTFDAWLAIPDTDESGTDPTALAVPASTTWVVAYRTDLDVPRLRRYVPGAPAGPAAASSTFVDIPVTPPAA